MHSLICAVQIAAQHSCSNLQLQLLTAKSAVLTPVFPLPLESILC
jgi:hypothetical protein